MNHNIIYAAIGFIIGSIAGGFFMGCYCGKVYKKRIDALESENAIMKETETIRKNQELSDREKKVENHKLSKKTVAEIVGYNEYIAPEHEEEDAEEEDNIDLEDDIEFDDPFSDEDDEREMIRVISKKVYNEDLLQNRDNESLTYYVEDGILADSYDDPVQNAAEIIGIEAIEKAETTDEDEIYVSNDIEDKIYEIVVERNESYYRDVLR